METARIVAEVVTLVGSVGCAGYAVGLSWREHFAKAAFYMAFAAWLAT